MTTIKVVYFLIALPRRSCTTLLDIGPCGRGTFTALLQASGFDEARFSLVLLLSCGTSLFLIEWICSGEVGATLVVGRNKVWQWWRIAFFFLVSWLVANEWWHVRDFGWCLRRRVGATYHLVISSTMITCVGLYRLSRLSWLGFSPVFLQ